MTRYPIHRFARSFCPDTCAPVGFSPIEKRKKRVESAFVRRDADNGMRAFWRTRLLVLVCVTTRDCVYPSAANSQSTRSRESPTADGWRHSAGCYRCLRTSVAIYGRLSAATDQETWLDSRCTFSENRKKYDPFQMQRDSGSTGLGDYHSSLALGISSIRMASFLNKFSRGNFVRPNLLLLTFT